MKIAIIHDSLIEYGGAERVLDALLRMFPRADLYTSFLTESYREKYLSHIPSHRIHTSWIQHMHMENHTSLIQSLTPLVWGAFRLRGYDLVISHSLHLMAPFVSVPESADHVVYLQSLPKNIFGIDPKTRLQKILPYTGVIRRMYCNTLRNTPHIIVNSRHTRRALLDHVGTDSSIIFPPVTIPDSVTVRKGKYYILVSRLDRSKSIELAVEACTRLRIPLRIIGKTNEPGYETYLRSIAGPTVSFLGELSDRAIDKQYEHAIAFLFPSKNEDFGIAPLESLAHGIPVIAYRGGGPTETIIHGKTGVMFTEHGTQGMIDAIGRSARMRFRPEVLRAYAKRYGEDEFRKKFLGYIAKIRRKKR